MKKCTNCKREWPAESFIGKFGRINYQCRTCRSRRVPKRTAEEIMSRQQLDNRKLMGVVDTSRLLGLTPTLLRVWELRYGFPAPDRDSNGYRLYSPALIRQIQSFVEAGKPFHEIDLGQWYPKSGNTTPAKSAGTLTFPRVHQKAVSPSLIQALLSKNLGKVAEHLAGLPRLRPSERQAVIQCVRDANAEMGGRYEKVLQLFLGVVA